MSGMDAGPAPAEGPPSKRARPNSIEDVIEEQEVVQQSTTNKASGLTLTVKEVC